MDTKILDIEGALLINNFSQHDKRGIFVKTYTNIVDSLKELSFEVNEIYYSISEKNVIRGMHFQRPSMDHAKIIYLTSGKITDVILDLRRSSKSYKKYLAIDLSAHQNALYIPSGIAHGFLAKEDYTTVVYNQSKPYSNEHDDGILWNSFEYDWGVDQPILSDRDKMFIGLEKFESPFD